VQRFIHPEEFANWRKTAIQMGFVQVASGPFVRSSYQAEKLYSSL
jgi:lipoic acid synthetase